MILFLNWSTQIAAKLRSLDPRWLIKALFANGRSLFVVALTATAIQTNGMGEEPVFLFNEGSCQYREKIAYRTISGARCEIHLVQCGLADPKSLFHKEVSSRTHAPICLSNAVILTAIDGTVSKYDFGGNLIFSTTLPNFEGASKFGMRFNDRVIILQRTWFKQGHSIASHEILFVDVSQRNVSIKGRVATEEVVKIVRVGSSLFGCGTDKSWQLEVPDDLRQ